MHQSYPTFCEMLCLLLFLCGVFTHFSGIFGSVVLMNDSSPVELVIVVPVLDENIGRSWQSNSEFLFFLGIFKAAVAYSLEKCNDRLEPQGLHLTPVFVHDQYDPTSVPEGQVGLKTGVLELIREYHGICYSKHRQEKNATVVAFLSNTYPYDFLNDDAKTVEIASQYFCAPLERAMSLEYELVYTTTVLSQMMQELQGVTIWFTEIETDPGSFNLLNNLVMVWCKTNCTARPCLVSHEPKNQYISFPEPAAVYIIPKEGLRAWEDLVDMVPYLVKKHLNRQTQAVVILSHGVVDSPPFFTYSNRSNWDIYVSGPYYEQVDKILKTTEVLAIQATNPDKSVPRYLKNLRYGDLIGKDYLKELKQFMELKCNEGEDAWSNYTSCPLNYTLPEAYNTQFFNTVGKYKSRDLQIYSTKYLRVLGIVPFRTNIVCGSLEDLLVEKCGEATRGVCDEFWEGLIVKEHFSEYINLLNQKEQDQLESGVYYSIYHLNTSSYTWRVVGQVNATAQGSDAQFVIHWFDEELIARLRRIIDTNPFNCQDNQHQTCKNYERKVSNQTCCFSCIPCDPFSYPNPKKFMQDCKNCTDGQVFSQSASVCVWSVTPMIDWTKAGDFGITCFIIIVLILSLVCLALSIYKRSSPILKMSLPVHFFGTISLAVLSCICGLITVGGFVSESDGLGGFCVFLWFFVCVTIGANAIFLLTKLQTYGPLVDFCIGGTMQQLLRRKLITASVLATIQVIIIAGTAASFHGTPLIVLNKRSSSWGNDCLWVTALENGKFLPSLLFPLLLQFGIVVRAGLFVRSHVSVKFINREILIILVCAVVQLVVGIAVLVLIYSDVPQMKNLTQGEGKMLILLIYSVLIPAIGVLVLVVPQLVMMMCRCGFLNPNQASGPVTSDLLMNRLRA